MKNMLLLSSAPCESNMYLSTSIVQIANIQMLYEWFDDTEIPEIETNTIIDPERQFSKKLIMGICSSMSNTTIYSVANLKIPFKFGEYKILQNWPVWFLQRKV